MENVNCMISREAVKMGRYGIQLGNGEISTGGFCMPYGRHMEIYDNRDYLLMLTFSDRLLVDSSLST